VLSKYGVKFKQPNKEYLRADCPLPSHTSEESKGSFAVNLEKNIWCCKSTSCNELAKKKGGDVLDFVSLMESCAILPAAKKLLEWFPTIYQNGRSVADDTSKKSKNVDVPSPAKPVPSPEENPENKPLGFELKGIAYHPYLEGRGIPADFALKFGVGFFPGKGSMSGRIVFPLRNESWPPESALHHRERTTQAAMVRRGDAVDKTAKQPRRPAVD
jgi:hypothetical protein